MSLGVQGGSINEVDKITDYHYWRKFTCMKAEERIKASDEGFQYDAYRGSNLISFSSYNTSPKTVVEYSDSISIDQSTGIVSLVNPTTLTISTTSAGSTLNNKYFKVKTIGDRMNAGFNTSDIYFVYTGGDFANHGNYYIGLTYNSAHNMDDIKIIKSTGAAPGEYLSTVLDKSDSAYPKPYGQQDGFYYAYVGVPLDRALFAPKIEVVEYTGTGVYGSANPNSITFSFVPKYVMIYGYHTGSGETAAYLRPFYDSLNHPLNTDLLTTNYEKFLMPSMENGSYTSHCYGKKSADGKTISWYCTYDNPSSTGTLQRNTKKYKYYCVGIG